MSSPLTTSEAVSILRREAKMQLVRWLSVSHPRPIESNEGYIHPSSDWRVLHEAPIDDCSGVIALWHLWRSLLSQYYLPPDHPPRIRFPSDAVAACQSILDALDDIDVSINDLNAPTSTALDEIDARINDLNAPTLTAGATLVNPGGGKNERPPNTKRPRGGQKKKEMPPEVKVHIIHCFQKGTKNAEKVWGLVDGRKHGLTIDDVTRTINSHKRSQQPSRKRGKSARTNQS